MYLTNWCFWFQTIYFIIALVDDLLDSSRFPAIRKLRDYAYATFSFPFAFAVTGLFWGLYALDPELVYPQAMRQFFPFWFNLYVHLNIAIFASIELYILYHKYPSRKSSLITLFIVGFSYIIWLYLIRLVTGNWVYAPLGDLTVVQRVSFIAFSAVFTFSLYFVGRSANDRVWKRNKID